MHFQCAWRGTHAELQSYLKRQRFCFLDGVENVTYNHEKNKDAIKISYKNTRVRYFHSNTIDVFSCNLKERGSIILHKDLKPMKSLTELPMT